MEQFIFIGGPWDGRREVLPGDPVVRVTTIGERDPDPFGYPPTLETKVPFTTVDYRRVSFRFNDGIYHIYLAPGIPEDDIPVLLLSGYRSF
jgi:hypothetical protein